MLSAVHTLTPASSSSWTSCQRFGCRLSGALVWASSSPTISLGLRSSAASRSNSSSVRPRYSILRRAGPRALRRARSSRRGHGSRRARRRHRRLRSSGARVLPHGVGLADAGPAPRKTFSRPSLPAERRQKRVRIRASVSGRLIGPSELVGRHDAFNPSSAKFSRKTLTLGSPINPKARPSIALSPTPAPCPRASPAPSRPRRLGPGQSPAKHGDRGRRPKS